MSTTQLKVFGKMKKAMMRKKQPWFILTANENHTHRIRVRQSNAQLL